MESTSGEAIGQVEIVAERKDRNDLGVGLKEQTSATQKINMEDLVATPLRDICRRSFARTIRRCGYHIKR